MLGKYIKSQRTSKNLSQEKFAELVGVHRNYIGSIERGEKSLSAYVLYQILASLNLNINEITKIMEKKL